MPAAFTQLKRGPKQTGKKAEEVRRPSSVSLRVVRMPRAFLRLWMDGRTRTGGWMDGGDARGHTDSLARSPARSSTGLPHLAHSHCTKSYGGGGRRPRSRRTEQMVAFACWTPSLPAAACSGPVGWMARGSVRQSAHRRSNAIMSCPRRKTASYFQERHELPSSH